MPLTVAYCIAQQNCDHSSRFTYANEEWPILTDLPVLPENDIIVSDIGNMIQRMDDTLFYEDKKGWDECKLKMESTKTKFTFALMATKSKKRGCAVYCNQCLKGCAVTFSNRSLLHDKEVLRLQWLSFWGCEYTVPGNTDPRRR